MMYDSKAHMDSSDATFSVERPMQGVPLSVTDPTQRSSVALRAEVSDDLSAANSVHRSALSAEDERSAPGAQRSALSVADSTQRWETDDRTLGAEVSAEHDGKRSFSATTSAFGAEDERSSPGAQRSDGIRRQTSALTSVLRGSSWLIVVGSALAMSWWSLFELALSYRVPLVLAVGVSTIYDGAALVLGDLARRYAMTTDSGLMPRVGMLALIIVSAWLNREHAVLLGMSAPGQVLLCAPSLVAGLVWELERRWDHREAMRAVGRVPEALPVLGRWAWLMFPRRALSTERAVVSAQLSAVALSADTSALSAEVSVGSQCSALSADSSALSADSSALSADSSALSADSSALSADSSALSAGFQRSAPVQSQSSVKRLLIDEALAVLGTGPEVTAPLLHVWLTQHHVDVSIGMSTVRARLASVRRAKNGELSES